jgi:hypothetical protein
MGMMNFSNNLESFLLTFHYMLAAYGHMCWLESSSNKTIEEVIDQKFQGRDDDE